MDSPSRRLSESWQEFANDLWINRRNNMIEPIERLNEKMKQSTSEQLTAKYGELIRFFKFLANECSGQKFTTDKQWSELLNIMQISRKLNHRSVKFKDIVQNKEVIEANRKPIYQLNKTAKLGQLIENSLKFLDTLLVQECRLEIPDTVFQGQLISAEVSKAIDQIQSKSQPSLRFLKFEPDDRDLVSSFGVSVVETWRIKLHRFEGIYAKLNQFLRHIWKLELNLQQLKPLMSVPSSDKTTRDNNSDRNQPSFGNRIQACRLNYNMILAFRIKLLKFMQKSASVKGSKLIQLSKLLDAHGNFIDNQLLNSNLNESLNKLIDCSNDLDKIMQELRLEYGRFYFVNNIELLRIIALDIDLVLNCELPENSRLIRKLFGNSISSLLIRDGRYVIGVKNPLGEEVLLATEEFISIRKKINIYSMEIVRIFNELTRKLRKHLKGLIISNFSTGSSSSINWSLPIQLVIVSDYILFTRRVEQIFEHPSDQNIDKLLADYQNRSSSLSSITEQKEGEDYLRKLKKSAIASLSVNFISILIMLKSNGITRRTDWSWQKQIRYYIVGDIVEVHLAGSKYEYKFDYLHLDWDENRKSAMNDGQALVADYKRLINTRVTENCMLVASYAVCNLGLGANPYGPAGSGKTETIKALGNMLGCHVIVHNCDDSNDSESLERLVWGLAHTGLWGCFDEFNRLSSSVLSSISGVLESVQVGLREKKSTIEWLAGQIKCIDPTSAFFITLNPVGNDNKYKGRRELPANLRSLFVPVSMVQVQIGSIVSESLMNYVYSSNKIDCLSPDDSLSIGHKLSEFLKQMKSTNDNSHTYCEWDLRLIIAILNRFKIIVETRPQAIDDCKSLIGLATYREIGSRLPTRRQDSLVQALNELFDLKSDLDQVIGSNDIPMMDRLQSSTKLELNPTGNFDRAVKLASELYYQLQTRTGVLLLGPTRSGKSTTWRILSKCLIGYVQWFAINPRSCSKLESFGYADTTTGNWVDGILTQRLREAQSILLNSAKLEQIWLILDGPIDPDWIEQLNSVLDDNKTLTLSSGERLDLFPAPNKSIKLIFETVDISNASPATISRLGLVLHENIYESSVESRLATKVAISEADIEAEFMEKAGRLIDECRLCIIAGASSYYRQKFLSQVIVETHSMVSYTCCRYSKAKHLLDLIERCGGYKYIVIHNLENIGPEDEWGTRTFFEMLRYISTYNSYIYEGESKNISTKLIATVDNLEILDSRLVSTSRVIDLGLEKTVNERNNATTIDTLEESFNSCSIMALDSRLIGLGRCNILKALFKERFELLTFGNSMQAQSSLEDLSNQLNNSETFKKRLYILHESEYCLLPTAMKEKLSHLLNLLGSSGQKDTKFIYLCHSLRERIDEYLFWLTIGEVFQYEDGQTYSSLLDKYLSETLVVNNSSYISDIQVDWLNSKIGLFVDGKLSNQRNLRQFKAFLDSLNNSLQMIFQITTDQKSALESGLENLSRFERSIEKSKAQLKKENEDIELKKREIEALVLTIEQTLKDSTGRKNQLEELKANQNSKNKQIMQRSSKLDTELASVERLMTESKEEISQHLKAEALNEIKTLRSPPKTIKDILDVLFVLLEIKDTSWASIKTYLTKYSLIEELSKYDFQKRFNESLLRKVEDEIKTKGNSFSAQQAMRASSAIIPILKWIQAALAYGRVLIQLRPLTDEMNKLKSESLLIEQTRVQLADEQALVDERINAETNRLKSLKSDLDIGEKSTVRIGKQLDLAQKVRSELNYQFQRWRQRLEILSKMSDANQIIRLALMSAYLAIYHNGDPGDLKSWCEFCELNWRESISTLWSLHKDNQLDCDSVEDDDSLLKIVNLLSAKLSLDCDHLVPFYYPQVSMADQLDIQELVSLLCHKELICRSDRDISVIKCSQQSTDWLQAIEIGSQVGSITILQLDDSALDLDLLHLILNRKSEQKLILFGRLAEHEQVEQFCRPIATSMQQDNMDRMIKRIVSRLTASFDPDLGLLVSRLEGDLYLKQCEIRNLEAELLKSLTYLSRSDNAGVEANLNENFVGMLSDLNRASDTLNSDVSQLKDKMAALRNRQLDYLEVAQSAAEFYTNNLVDLVATNRFYHLSLDKYIDLLLKGSNKNSVDSMRQEKFQSINYSSVIDFVLCSMLTRDRQNFCRRLYQSQQNVRNTNEAIRSYQLESVIGDSLNLDDQHCKLMILVHDAKKSNPLLKLDDIFSKKGVDKKNNESSNSSQNVLGAESCLYRKVYGSCEKNSRLEIALNEVLSMDSRDTNRDDQSTNATKTTKRPNLTRRCLCIANAHLSAAWINANLVRLLRTNKKSGNKELTNVLIILVVDSFSFSKFNKDAKNSHDELNGLSTEVIDLAHVKYWHDDSSLPLVNRYQLLERSMATMHSNSQHDKAERKLLSRQLILMHVIFQELAKLREEFEMEGKTPEISVWQKTYSFDLDQLWLANKILSSLEGHNSNGELRLLFSNYLSSLVYGSRLECDKDERLFAIILHNCIANQSKAREKLARFDELLIAGTQINKNERKSTNTELESSSYSELISFNV